MQKQYTVLNSSLEEIPNDLTEHSTFSGLNL